SLFGDLYYNATRIEIANFAKGMKKYPMNAITSYLKLIMQDVLAHLAGSTSFIDACMVKDKLHFECMINNKIGKRKLVEFFALLEELDKQGIHMDELDFAKNNNDRFLEQVIKERRKGILQDYLAFNNLNDFFDMVMMISTIMPMAKRVEDFDVFIPNPVDFDFKSKYYDSIDYLAYYMDKEKHDSLMSKHEKNGSEVNLVQWIKNYKNRYAIKDILREEMGIETDGYDRSVASDNPINNAFLEKIVDFAKSEYDFSADEIDYLRLILKEKNKEISILRSQIVEMRNSIKVILDHQDVKLSDGEIEKLEEEFISEAAIKHITKKSRVNKGVKVLIYSAIVASLVLIPTFGLLNNLNDGEKSYVGKKEPVRIEQEKEKQDEIKDEFQENLENEEQDLQIGVDLPEEDTFPKDSLAEEETWENDT
ncbi:MAG: hypothetical protein K2I70_00610, partial [Bacilli bacterium]|nr:hypothetical protein [Bacilli bacterium]